MLRKRIIPCLDVKDGKVVKGVQFRNHQVLGDILEFAQSYCEAGADELVFYDITASPDGRRIDRQWIKRVAEVVDIPFCVAGGIKSVQDAYLCLESGADKISVNSKALENPSLIDDLSRSIGSQSVVVGIDSQKKGSPKKGSLNSGKIKPISHDHLQKNSHCQNANDLTPDQWTVYQDTGRTMTTKSTGRSTLSWIKEVVNRGAGEIVLNCMSQDGMGDGYDIEQLTCARSICLVPLIASGGAGRQEHFLEAFTKAEVDGALAAGAFHRGEILVPELKRYLSRSGLAVRLHA